MKILIAMAMLAALSSAASAGTECTNTIPQLAGRDGTQGLSAASEPGRQALLGCDAGGASLLLPGVGVFSWAAANMPDSSSTLSSIRLSRTGSA